jgi:hypothetical protein
MQINSLSSRSVGLPTLPRGNDTAEAVGSGQAETTAESGASTSSPAFRQILSQYDVSSISPRQFSEMLTKLHQSGTISDQQYQNLSQIRTDLDSSGVQPDEEVDLVKFYSQKVSQTQKSAAASPTTGAAGQPQSLNTTQARLDWLRKVSTIQSDPAPGIDSMA